MHRSVALLLIVPLFALLPASCVKKKDSGEAAKGTTASAPASTEQVAGNAPSPSTPQPPVDPVTGLTAVALRKAAPEISSPILDGSSWSLTGSKGKVVLVDFWATWCPPCRKGIPHLIDLQKEYGSRGLQVIGISLDQQGKPVVDPFVRDAKINYPIIIDAAGKYAALYGGVEGIPTLFMIDRSGRIARTVVGYVPKEVLAPAVQTLLNEG